MAEINAGSGEWYLWLNTKAYRYEDHLMSNLTIFRYVSSDGWKTLNLVRTQNKNLTSLNL